MSTAVAKKSTKKKTSMKGVFSGKSMLNGLMDILWLSVGYLGVQYAMPIVFKPGKGFGFNSTSTDATAATAENAAEKTAQEASKMKKYIPGAIALVAAYLAPKYISGEIAKKVSLGVGAWAIVHTANQLAPNTFALRGIGVGSIYEGNAYMRKFEYNPTSKKEELEYKPLYPVREQ